MSPSCSHDVAMFWVVEAVVDAVVIYKKETRQYRFIQTWQCIINSTIFYGIGNLSRALIIHMLTHRRCPVAYTFTGLL